MFKPKNKRNQKKAAIFAYSDLFETGGKGFFAFVPTKKGLILTEIIVSNLCSLYGAIDETRTHTFIQTLPPQSSASTYSATIAYSPLGV